MPTFKINANQMVYPNQDECATYFMRCGKDTTNTKVFQGKRQYEMWRKLHSKKCSCLLPIELKTSPIIKKPYSDTLQNGHRNMDNLNK